MPVKQLYLKTETMRTYLLTLVLFFSFMFAAGQNMKYSRIRLQADSQKMLKMAEAGINLDDAIISGNNYMILETSENELEIMSKLSVDFEILISDLTKYYADRNLLPESKTDLHTGTALSEKYPIPQGFALGTLGGFSDHDACMAHLDQMFAMYPGLITPRTELGPLRTQEGYPVYMAIISNKEIRSFKPKILYDAMLHAREPIGMQHLLYYMYYLLENYGSDPVVTYLLDNAELYFVPILNPDGYRYNQLIAPNGGGMWRKNRRINGGDTYGVDMNRNFGFMWGCDNTGSSSLPTSEIYRGTEPFSEPEIFMLKELCEAVPFTIALNYHSYSNLLLYSWGYIKSVTPDDDIFSAHSRLMTRDNKYLTGASSILLYLVNGGSDDWMYGEQSTKSKIFSYTPEVGTSSDGFWPAINRIIPLCQENMTQSLTAGLLALQYAEFADQNMPYISENNGFLKFSIQRMGFQDGGNFTLSLEAISPCITYLGEPITFINPDLLETTIDSIAYSIDPDIAPGTLIQFLAILDNGHYTISDTIIKAFGTPELVFYDACNNTDNWTGGWSITSNDWVSPPSSITDSPSGNYPGNLQNSFTTTQTIDLSGAVWAQLSFYARWDIQKDWDYVQLLASDDNGISWTPLAGKYTIQGNIFQKPGQPVYDGTQTKWVHEMINLTPFSDKEIILRFTLVSNSFFTSDGFYFDDISVIKITSNEVTMGSENQSELNDEFIVFPNPARNSVIVSFTDNNNPLKIELADLGGKIYLSYETFDELQLRINTTNLSNGIYLLRIIKNDLVFIKKLVVLTK